MIINKREKQTEGWKCRCCYKQNNNNNNEPMANIPMMLFCEHPSAFDDLPEGMRESRARVSADLCAIDNTKFYIRALIELPLLLLLLPSPPPSSIENSEENSDNSEENHNNNNNNYNNNNNNNNNKENKENNIIIKEGLCGCYLTLGVWVQVKQMDFFQIIEKWSTDEIISYEGNIANQLPNYEVSTLGLPVVVTTRSKKRPIISFNTFNHPLPLEVKEGIRISNIDQFLSVSYR